MGAKSFTETSVNVTKRKLMKVPGKRSVTQKYNVHLEEHLNQKRNHFDLFYALLFLSNLVFKFNMVLTGNVLYNFHHNLFTFLPFD